MCRRPSLKRVKNWSVGGGLYLYIIRLDLVLKAITNIIKWNSIVNSTFCVICNTWNWHWIIEMNLQSIFYFTKTVFMYSHIHTYTMRTCVSDQCFLLPLCFVSPPQLCIFCMHPLKAAEQGVHVIIPTPPTLWTSTHMCMCVLWHTHTLGTCMSQIVCVTTYICLSPACLAQC